MTNTPPFDFAAHARIQAAIKEILKREPFFGHIAHGLRWRQVAAERMPTCATNGTSCYYNSEWINSLSDDHLLTVVVHEVLHVAYLHPFRAYKAKSAGVEIDPLLWNIAGDIVVNNMLARHGFTVFEGMVHSPHMANGRSTEQIYELLQNNPKNKPMGGKGEGGKQDWGDVESPYGLSEDEGQGHPDEGGDKGFRDSRLKDSDDREQEAKRNVQRAAAEAKQRGNMPGDLEQIVEAMYSTSADWKDITRRYMGEGSQVDISWSRPNRRYISDGTYLPGKVREGIGILALVVDSSGSVDDGLVGKFLGEATKIRDDLQPDETIVIMCDAQVQSVHRFGTYEEIRVPVKGRGGTNFAPAFRWLEQNGVDPRLVVYFTDLYGPAGPRCALSDKTMWVVWPGGGEKIDWGEVVRM